MTRYSVALTGQLHASAVEHLDRADGQEDICLLAYRPSTGSRRSTAVLSRIILPGPDDRLVHGVASIMGDYVLRVAAEAARFGEGIAIAHSHPGARSWQGMSGPDEDTERSFASLAQEITGLPLVGLTLGTGNGTWSGRVWGVSANGDFAECESVRIVGDQLVVSWHPVLRPEPRLTPRTQRTVHSWGTSLHRNICRLRILVVGSGSVGMDVALRLAQSGFENIAVMDFDCVDESNLDRLIGATVLDAGRSTPKIDVARRLLEAHGTSSDRDYEYFNESVCEDFGLSLALDYDLIFSCVDRPWPRSVLNSIAYADLIPVIDGGVGIDTFDDGSMRNAVWRSHVVRPGRPCLVCNGQIDPAEVARDRQGLLDDPAYLAGLGMTEADSANVSMISINAVAALLAQFVSYIVAPSGIGDPGPLRFSLNTHSVEHLSTALREHCFYERDVCVGDGRVQLAGRHLDARRPSVHLDPPSRARRQISITSVLRRCALLWRARTRDAEGRGPWSGGK